MNSFELLSIAVEFRRLSRLWLTLVVKERFEESEIDLAIRCEAAFRRCCSRGCLPKLDSTVLDNTKNGAGFYEIVGYDRIFSKDDENNAMEYVFSSSSVRPGLIGDLSGGVYWLMWDTDFPTIDRSEFDLNSEALIEATFDVYSKILESVAATIEAYERRKASESNAEVETITITGLCQILKDKFGDKAPRDSTVRGWKKHEDFPKSISGKGRNELFVMAEVAMFSASMNYPLVIVSKKLN